MKVSGVASRARVPSRVARLHYDPLATVSTSQLPPALIVGAQYDTFLQRALARFFDRAKLETEAVPSPSSDGRLAIEPTADPCTLSVRWFGNRYMLRVPGQRP